jgi:7-cyano-7-deazaguanine synthase in queuosine biosynthesis
MYPDSFDIKASDQYLEMLNNYNNAVMQILADTTGKPFSVVLEDCKKDVFLTPEEALEYGIIDHIVDDFNQIIDIESSVMNMESKAEVAAAEEFRLKIISDLNLSCDAKCDRCDKSDSCSDLERINDHLNSLSHDVSGNES